MSNHQPAVCLIVLRHTNRARDGSILDEFRWSDKHQAHIWQGRELTPEELTAVWDSVEEKYQHYHNGIKPVVFGCAWKNLIKAREAKARKERQTA